MTLCTRRAFGGLAGAACLGARPVRAAAGAPRVVVIGGGAAGATAAKYLSLSQRPVNVTLIEPKERYTTCFGSNLYLAGLRSFDSLTHGYEKLAARHGVRVLRDRADAIDAAARTVRLASGGTVAFDRLIVAPGIAFRPNGLDGYDADAMETMPHAWMAGPQTQTLRRQLEAMSDGGTFLMVAPPDPFRCPPGPYERACLVASYFKREKPRSKVLIVDAKDSFFEEDLFLDAWARHYQGMVEWLPAQFTGGIDGISARDREVRTPGGAYRGDVVNVIPPQMAATLAHEADLADETGWCPVDPATFESTRVPGVHVIGDASSQGMMPKSAFAANSQAKTCAFAIAHVLTGTDPARPFLYNTCYTYLAPDDAVSDAISFKIEDGKTAIADIEISRLDEDAGVRAHAVREAEGWYAAFTRDLFG